MVSLRSLVGIAGVGGVVLSATGITLYQILQKQVADSPVLQEVMDYVNRHPGLDPLLGKPIKNKRIDLSSKNNVRSLRFTCLEVPVKGPKAHGKLTILADRLSGDDKWNVYNIELELLDNYGGKVNLRNKPPLLDTT